MTIMTRLIKLFKADIHGVMDQLEDRSLLLNQSLRDMEEALEQNQTELKSLNASASQLKSEYEKYTQKIELLEKDLTSAVKKDKDDIARFLIKKIKPLKAYHKELKSSIKNIEQETAQLRETLEQKKLQYERLQLKSREYFRKNQKTQYNQNIPPFINDDKYKEPCKEEIELELIQRKEAVKGGQNYE